MNLLTSESSVYGDAIGAKITKTISGDSLETDTERKLITKLTKKTDGIFDLQMNFESFSAEGTYEATFYITKYYIKETPSSSIAMKNETIAIQITKEATTDPNLLGSTETISNTAQEASGYINSVTSVMAAFSIVMAADPTGMLLKFVFVIETIYKLKFINVYFGDLLTIMLSGLGQQANASEEEKQKILELQNGSKEKFNVFWVTLSLTLKNIIYCSLYTVSWIIRFINAILYLVAKKR